MNSVICPYCKNEAVLVSGLEIYPHREDLASKKFWQCSPCNAYVGCHAPNVGYGDGTQPLGRLANAELRRAKSQAHEAFDALWRSKRMSRKQAYAWLANSLHMQAADAHIGMFDVEQCKAVVTAVRGLK